MAGIFEIGPTTVVQVVNFGFLAVVLKFVLYDPLSQAVKERQDRVKNLLSEAENVNNHAKVLKSQYEDKLKKVEAEGAALYQKMLSETQSQREERLKTLEADLQNLRDKTERELKLAQAKAFAALRQEVGELALQISQKLLAGVLQPEIQGQIQQTLIKQLEAGNKNGA